MADLTRYVNTESTSGGNGTTNDITGVNRAYPTAAQCVSAEALIGLGGDHLTIIASGGRDSDVVNFVGTGAAKFTFMTEGAQYPNGVFDPNKYYLDKGPGLGGTIIVNDDFVDIIGIQIRRDGPLGVGSERPSITISAQAPGNEQNIIDCVIHSVAEVAGAAKKAILCLDTDTNLTIKNTVVYNFNDSNDIAFDLACNVKVINCNAINCTTGVTGNATTEIVNTLFQDCGTDVRNTVDTVNSGYNLTDKASGLPGTNNVYNATPAFMDKANNDYHLYIDDLSALSAGVGPSVNPDVALLDAEGDARAGATSDIGFDESTLVPLVLSINPASSPPRSYAGKPKVRFGKDIYIAAEPVKKKNKITAPGWKQSPTGFMRNVTDPDGHALSYQITTEPSNATFYHGFAGNFTIYPDDGLVAVSSFFFNPWSNGRPSVNTYEVNVSYDVSEVAPIFTSNPVITNNSGALYEYNIVCTDANDDPLVITAPTLPAFISATKVIKRLVLPCLVLIGVFGSNALLLKD